MTSTNQTLKIGSRVRCTDDHIEGRIAWANGTSVKIKWDDGEQVTWRRDSLATRPIEILDAESESEERAEEEASVATPEPTVTSDLPATEAETPSTPTEAVLATEQATIEPEPATPEPVEGATPVPAKPKRERKKAEPKEKKVSALDAAAKVLGEVGQPMTCQELITEMSAKGYWTSPGGKTPASTLYAAILRETAKGEASRFRKTDRGKFTLQGNA